MGLLRLLKLVLPLLLPVWFLCRKDSKLLGEKWTRGIPIEVLAFASVPVIRKIKYALGGKPILRMAANKAVRRFLCGPADMLNSTLKYAVYVLCM